MKTYKYTYNPNFSTKKVRNFVSELICNYGYKYFEDLSDADKCEFAGLLIEAAGKDGENECLVESTNLDQIVGYLKKSLLNDKDDENLIYFLKKNTINYYEDTMFSIFMDERERFDCEMGEWLDKIDSKTRIHEILNKQGGLR